MAAPAISQSSALGAQGLVQGASQSRSSDITTSNSVINSSSSAVTAQSGDSQWLDNWDKPPGSQPNTPRLDQPNNNNPVTPSHYSNWASPPFSSSFNADPSSTATTKWPPTSNSSNMQSAWAPQSQSLGKPQASTSSDWIMPTPSTTASQWPNAAPASSAAASGTDPNSWGPVQRLPNAGTDNWSQATPPGGQPNTPSSASAQLSQWAQPPHSAASTQSSAWPSSTSSSAVPATTSSNQPPSAAVPPSPSNSSTSASAVLQTQYGATTSAGQANVTTSAAAQDTAAPTSWAAAAGKGLPRTHPKPPEQVDPVKQAIEQTINSPDSWGRTLIRQDTTWGSPPPEKTKQDESNHWYPTQNNGTAIWDSVKASNGQAPADKSTWNQKVAGNNDPNVWNGEGSKGKDNALWDDVPSSKDAEPVDPAKTWTSQGPPSRTVSQSSGGAGDVPGPAGPDNSWPTNGAGPGHPGAISRSSPPNSINQQPTNIGPADPNWASQNSNVDPRKSRWDANSAQPPMRVNSMSNDTESDSGVGTNCSPVVDTLLQHSRLLAHGGGCGGGQVAAASPLQLSSSRSSGNAVAIQPPPPGNGRGQAPPASIAGSSYWDQGQMRGGAPPKSQGSWPNDNAGSASSWPQPQSGVAGVAGGGGHGGWGDGPSNQWQSGAGANRKPSLSWDDNQSNGDNGRERRQMKNEPELGDDADMGDWNESNSVWSSAGGFKQSRKHAPIPENHMSQHMQSNRMPGGGQFGNAGGPGAMMNSGGAMGGLNSSLSTKQQMLQYLVNHLKFPKDEAHSALINNNMNVEAAISELNKNSSMQQQQQMGGGRPPQHDFGGMSSGPNGDNTFNPNIPPPNMPTNALNTPYTNNAQLNQSAVQGSSRNIKPNQQQRAPGRGNTMAQQQAMLVKQLELGVQMNNIHPQILHTPLGEQNVRVIQQLLNLQGTYQQHQDNLLMLQRRHGQNSHPQIENLARALSSISAQMKAIQQPLLNNNKMMHHNQVGKLPGGMLESLANLILMSNYNPQQQQPAVHPPMPPSSQSRLGIWTDKAPGSRQGGVLGDNSPWSSSGASSGMWASNMSPSGQYLDNTNESQSVAGNPSNGPQGHAAATHSSQSFDIPEFVPGVPWQGANSHRVEDDPNITPGSVARSISVSTAPPLNGSGRNSADIGWGGNLASKNTWASLNPSSPASGVPGTGDMWGKNTRPPPGFNKNMNRSLSMPQGPSEKLSAFSPVGASWDNQQGASGSQAASAGSPPWLLLRNLPMHADGNTLKTLCSQHGPLQSFFVNSTNGQAIMRYTTKEESLKAQKTLQGGYLYDTTITAEFVDEQEVQRIIDQCQRQGSLGRSHSVSAAPGSAMWPNINNNSGSSSNLWGGSGIPSSAPGAASSSTWAGLPGGFLPAVDITGNNFAM